MNHGSEGPAVQGDCWEGYTPDILPGDRVVVTDSSGAKDEVTVDNVTTDEKGSVDASSGRPALDCGNPSSPFYAPHSANAVATSDDKYVNLDSGRLKLGGTAAADVTAVRVTLSDGEEDSEVTVEATRLTEGPGEKAWSAEFTREQVEKLADGTLTASGEYELEDGSTTTGATKRIEKDTVAPELPTASPEEGQYDTTQWVALEHSETDSAAKIYYTAGSEPDTSTLYTREIQVNSSQRIEAIVVDGAGNESNVASFDYTIRQDSATTLNLSTTELKRGNVLGVSGTVSPSQAGETVKMTINRNGAKFLEQDLTLDSSSAYSLSFRPPTGFYTVSISFAGDEDHKPSTSPTRAFRVVRT